MSDEKKMTDKHYIALQTDVKAILTLLEGNKRFRQKGLVDNVEENKEKITKARIERDTIREDIKDTNHRVDKLIIKIVSYAGGAAAIGSIIVQLVIGYFF